MVKPSWPNSGVRVLRLRKDGFVSVVAPYIFNVNVTELPEIVTQSLSVPNDCPNGVALGLNVETSVAGFVVVEIQKVCS